MSQPLTVGALAKEAGVPVSNLRYHDAGLARMQVAGPPSEDLNTKIEGLLDEDGFTGRPFP